MAAMTIEADFRQDWASYLLRELDRLGCRVDPTRDAEELAVAFFNALKRRIPPQPRQVLTRLRLRPTRLVSESGQ
jgi:hypothetical protein